MEILVPDSCDGHWTAHLGKMEALRPLLPFAPEPISFVDAFSKAVFSDSSMRSYPELMALAHWMRKRSILDMKAQFEAERGSRVFLPRGIVLHFAPSNVETIFVYSWFLSLLMGNLNVVRLSTGRSSQLTHLLSLLNRVLARSEMDAVRERSLIVSFEHDDAVTRALSAVCQVRVIWGGDQTVSRLREIPIAPLATEVVFPDRFSLAAFKAAAMLAEDETGFHNVIGNFFNDSFWFDQMACSSPRLVVWVGTSVDIEKAKQRFWPALEDYVVERGVKFPYAIGITRMTTMYAYAATGVVDTILSPPTAVPGRAHIGSDVTDFRDSHCGSGLFLERECEQLQDIAPLLKPKDQTMAVFGFGAAEIRDFVQMLPSRAIDRVVQLGRALNFSRVWDGIDFLRAFSREVEISCD